MGKNPVGAGLAAAQRERLPKAQPHTFLARVSTRWQIIFWGIMQLPAFAALEVIFRLERPYDPTFASNDVSIYFASARSLLAGQMPYRDFFFQYPPAALLFFIPSALNAESAGQFFSNFKYEIFLLNWVMLAATAFIALRTGQSLNRTLLLYTLAVPAIGSMLWQRYDVAPALLILLAFAVWLKGWHSATWLLLALGTVVKIYPGLLAPLFAIAEYRSGGLHRAARGLALFVGLVVLGFAPFFIASFQETANIFLSQSGRGFEIESVGSTLMVVAGWFGLPAQAIYRRRLNTWDIDSPAADPLQVMFLGLEAAVTLLVYWKCWREKQLDPLALVRYALALVALNLLTTRVFSAQYVIWLFPLALLIGEVRLPIAGILFVVVALLTQWMFPFSWEQLKQLAPYTAVALLTRDGLLLAVSVVVLRKPKVNLVQA